MRIAFATPEYVTEEYFDGGLANYLHRVARVLAGMGHDVHVVTLSEIDETEFQHAGVTVHRIALGGWRSPSGRSTRWRLPASLRALGASVRVYRLLRRLHRRLPLHMVQFPSYSCCGLVSMCCLGVPHVLRASSYQPALNDAAGFERNLGSWLMERLDGLQFRLSRNIYTPSDALQRTLVKEARQSRVRVIRPPFYIETPDWDGAVHERSLKGRKYLLFFGRFQLHKGFHTLAQALPRVLEQCPDAWVALVGRDMGSSLAHSMTDYARTRCGSAAERLVVLNHLPHGQLYPVIAGAHLVVLPSLIENLPNACLEAMGLGRVVIGTRGTSFEELIDEGETGFLVPPDDPEALADGIISAWTHPRLAAIGAAAQERVLEFSPEKTVETLLAYYREVLRG